MTGRGKKPTTRVLADFVCEMTPNRIPASARRAACKCILDLAAAASAGCRTPAARAVLDTAVRLFAPGRCGVWFSEKALNAPGAALANSAVASALDLDDGHRGAMGHPGAAVIPAALAVAQEAHASGEELLTAIVTGYEVGVRISAARDHTALDTLSTGRWCAYGAAAAGGWLRRLAPPELAQAMAVAGVYSPGLSAAGYSRDMGNSAKEGIAWATLTGLSALWLAEKGFSGPGDILDHRDYYDAGKIVAGLGRAFAIEKVYFKPYACCRWMHGAIDALLLILAENDLDAGLIDKLDVHLFERALRLTNHAAPATLEDAQYSVPFCVAAAAVEGQKGLLPLLPGLLRRGDIIDLARRIRLHHDPALSRLFPAAVPARVTVYTSKGVFEKQVNFPKGDPENPLTWAEIREKLLRLSGRHHPGRFADAVLEAVGRLETDGIQPLTTALGTRPVS